MKIYSQSSYGRANILVTPGKEHPEVREWFEPSADPEGKMIPRQLVVRFENGVAEVADNLGEYMIKHGLAQTNLVTLSGRQAARSAEVEREYLRNENLALRPQLKVANTRLQELQQTIGQLQDTLADRRMGVGVE